MSNANNPLLLDLGIFLEVTEEISVTEVSTGETRKIQAGKAVVFIRSLINNALLVTYDHDKVFRVEESEKHKLKNFPKDVS